MFIPVKLFAISLLLGTTLLLVDLAQGRGTYQEPSEFVHEAFGGQPPSAKVLWLKGPLHKQVTKILGQRYGALRIRYWIANGRSVWILEAIGKDQPITVGVVINYSGIEELKVLIFRESRGWEVRHSFFTDQFKGATLLPDTSLDRSIDGISGATLSVRALTRLARLALFLHQQILSPRDAS